MPAPQIRICLKTRDRGFISKLLKPAPKLLCTLSDDIGRTTAPIAIATDNQEVLKTEDTERLTSNISEIMVSLPAGWWSWCRPEVYLVMVVVVYGQTSRCFPFHCAVSEEGTTSKYRAVLPQNERERDRQSREERIHAARKIYQRSEESNGERSVPARVAKLPAAEGFSVKYLTLLFPHVVVGQLQRLFVSSVGYIKRLFSKYRKFDTLKDLYDGPVPDTTCCKPSTPFYTPRASLYWDTDEWFGLQRLIGVDPTIIRLCPPVDDTKPEADDLEKLLFRSRSRVEEHHLDGMTVAAALTEKRLFVCDLTFMKDFSRGPRGPAVPAPIALFFWNDDGDLLPVAIMLYNLAESNHHETTTHLMLTHLLMESFCLATHRHLDVSHPVFRLLWPHFHFLMAINAILNIGIEKGLELGRARLREWRIDVEGTLPAALEERGLADPTILKDKYLYRDDAMKLYNVLKKYATAYISYYYHDESMISSDPEIQDWATTLATHYDIKGVPNDGQLKTRDELILMVTCIIYTCSVGHASVNFAQYDQYGYPPNYPGCLKGRPSSDPYEHPEEEDAFMALASRGNMLHIMAITHLLSQRGDRRLAGGFAAFIVDQSDEIRACIKELKHGLRQIREEIKRRNTEYARQDPFHMMLYDYLDPSKIPNSIGI
ncbi:hypothetical protein BaRGS_00009155 [Batillaria attramentaria]|uniref:Lipoxygenase domain-containing protein n=1 Tax=Batillaria attramentaria TaxID=370345 RepID=A0ABD0LK66_9CAEN